MSEFKCPLTTIKEIKKHPNADKLEIAKCYDYDVIVQKGKFQVGDLVCYIPIDSLLSQDLENLLFPPDSKVKLHKHRVKQIKIQGTYSQGMVIDFQTVTQFLASKGVHKMFTPEEDLIELLGVTKYDPEPASFQGSNTGQQKRDKPKENPMFHKYGGIDNFKWYPNLFKEGELVSITEKIHGSNIRFGYVPYIANNLWRKLLKLLRLAPKFEWVYGSNNVQLQQRGRYKGFYGTDVYGAVLEKYDVKSKVKPNEIWYGELYGDGIQKGYNYGCSKGEHKLVVFDLKFQYGDNSYYVNVDEFQQTAKERGFEIVPELYRGPFNKEKAKELTLGDSVFVPNQKVREGVVIKPLIEAECSIGRKLLKLISEKYLENDQSDFH